MVPYAWHHANFEHRDHIGSLKCMKENGSEIRRSFDRITAIGSLRYTDELPITINFSLYVYFRITVATP